jgi:ABC-type microcin C transport system permease subunit YejE
MDSLLVPLSESELNVILLVGSCSLLRFSLKSGSASKGELLGEKPKSSETPDIILLGILSLRR